MAILKKPAECDLCHEPPTVIRYENTSLEDVLFRSDSLPRRPSYLNFHHTEGYGPGKALVGQWLCGECHGSARHVDREAIEELQQKKLECFLWKIAYDDPGWSLVKVRSTIDGMDIAGLYSSTMPLE